MVPPPPDPEAEDRLVPLSALQHYLYCPRQSALIHVEGLWAEDAATAQGRLLHARPDGGRGETRPSVRIARGLALRSFALGVSGRADVVEFPADGGAPVPVEYKRGRPKAHRADEVQLCAQAVCLEEMFRRPVATGFLFYGETRRRMEVAMDGELRALTARTAAAARADILEARTPPPVFGPHCRRCSLQSLCRPERMERAPPVAEWLRRQIGAG
ncbi:MAG: CRISPR-associated protein Cas4 [Methylobacterium sp.]|nr:CRISPR-associated protein Cas4 [Methylobacterium sp.]